MNQIKLPAGFRDSILEECTKKNKVKAILNEVFASYGYEEIVTPVLEYYQTYSNAFNTLNDQEMYKFFDRSQDILALRMDMTVPIARAVTTRFQDEMGPFRLHYCANVYKVRPSLAGKQSEATDCGVELIGLDSHSDLEVLTCALDGLQALDLPSHILEIGTVRFFDEACRSARLSEEQRTKLADLIDRKSMVELKDYLQALDLNDTITAFFLRLPLLSGGQDMLDEAYGCAFTPALREIVIELKGLADEWTALGSGRHVQFDLGKIAQLDYYTGIIFEGFIEGAGTSVLSGGRYDQLLKVFGNDLPACGFSFKLDALIDHIEAPEKRAKVRLIYGPRQKVEVMQLARDLRREQIVELVPGFTDEIIIKEVEA